MHRLSLRRATLAVLATAATAAAFFAGTAAAGIPLEQFHDHFTDSFSTDLCGIPVNAQIRVTDNFFVFADSFKDINTFRGTFTNPVNGKAVIN